MIEGISPVSQALLGTLFTWGLTALGAAVAIFIQGNQVSNCFFFFISLDDFGKKYVMYSRIYFKFLQRGLLDGSLGFAAGVMLAASYWSLLAPAIEMASEISTFGEQFSFVPVAIGFFLGAAFVYASDLFLSHAGLDSPINALLKNDHDNSLEEQNLIPTASLLTNGK